MSCTSDMAEIKIGKTLKIYSIYVIIDKSFELISHLRKHTRKNNIVAPECFFLMENRYGQTPLCQPATQSWEKQSYGAHPSTVA